MKRQKDKSTYCVVLVPSEEIVLTGVKGSEAMAWCNTYNQVMLGHEVQAEIRVQRQRLSSGRVLQKRHSLARLAG